MNVFPECFLVLGTIGGINVGVSPKANIYGLKVLNGDGSGSTADIIEALDYVNQLCADSSRRCIVSMSLGGLCERDDCKTDPLVQSVENMVAAGIFVVVAAGNEGCNACNGSPNAAPNAIVGQFGFISFHFISFRNKVFNLNLPFV